MIDTLKVLARANPEDKLLVVAGLKAQDKKVAVIGDGINDLKAFETADVSFAMASGTSVARNSASMVLTDNDFEACMRSVMWGRNIYGNVKRFLQFQITCNFSVIVTVFIGYLYLTESPLSAVQLLWINLIMDTLAALALATTPPHASVIREPPMTSEQPILTRVIWRQIYGVTLWNVIVMMIMIFLGKVMFDLDYANSEQTTDSVDGELTSGALAKKEHLTIIFCTFVFLQFFNEFNCRVVGPREFNVFKGFFRGWMFIFVMAVIFCVQWLACNWFAWFFDTTPLSHNVYYRTFSWGASVLLVALLLKLTPIQWVEKLPVKINENEVIGQSNILMRAYDAQAHAAVVSKPKPALDDSQLSAKLSGDSQTPAEPKGDDDSFQRA